MIKLNSILKEINQERVDEGWKENLLFLGAMALSGLGMSSQAQTLTNKDVPAKSPTEISQEKPTEAKKFYAAMVQATQELLWAGGSEKTVEEAGAIKEASIYFQNLRDGKTPKPLSKEAKVVVQHVANILKDAPASQIQRLATDGMSAIVR